MPLLKSPLLVPLWVLCRHTGLTPRLYVPLHITHEHSDKVKDVLQGICRRLQDVISKTPQENEEVTQIISKEFCKQRLCMSSS